MLALPEVAMTLPVGTLDVTAGIGVVLTGQLVVGVIALP